MRDRHSSSSSDVVTAFGHKVFLRLISGLSLMGVLMGTVLMVQTGASAQAISGESSGINSSGINSSSINSSNSGGSSQPISVQTREPVPNVRIQIQNSSIHQQETSVPIHSPANPTTGFANPTIPSSIPSSHRGPYYPATLDAALPFPDLVLPEIAPELQLVIRLSERRVYLYDRDNVQVSYPIAVGRAGWETPTGTYSVINMVVDPGWQNPFTGAVIPPGPSNPLGDRWIGFWTDGENFIGFHGTPNEGSVGRAASHGCIRMYNRDVRELFETVAVGTPVIVEP